MTEGKITLMFEIFVDFSPNTVIIGLRGRKSTTRGKEKIGREKEVHRLNELYNSGEAEFVAIYGRRRVGKTYLVSETFAGKMAFHHIGLSPIEIEESDRGTPLRKQLKHFYNSLLLHGMKKSRCPDNWLDAFFMLEKFLQEKDDGTRQVVFFDELPWMDTQKSGFLTAFEGFWNTWGCFRKNLMVIVCGSATMWIKNKLIENHGGLYGRLTDEIKLSPFSLKECKSFVENKCVKLSEYDIVQAYMMLIDIRKKYSRNLLLHGDLHHENILKNEKGGYTVIDPKGVIGDPVFDLSRFILDEFRDDLTSEPKDAIIDFVQKLGDSVGIPCEIVL